MSVASEIRPHRRVDRARRLRWVWVGMVAAVLGWSVSLLPRFRPSVAEPAILDVPRTELVMDAGRLVRKGESNGFTGRMLDLRPDGSLQSRSSLSNGVLNGLSEAWHTNGAVSLREWFVGGLSEGVRTRWDSEGRRTSESSIRSGRLEGWHREWHPNGQLAVEVQMANGKAEGIARRWSPDGAVAGEWRMSNGLVNRTMITPPVLRASADVEAEP